jgi:two-component system chemotaxis response regulator CheY
MNGKNVLVVDDSSVMRNIMVKFLQTAGLEFEKVFEAGNGAEALEIVKNQPISLILSDINMPTMDGLEFIRQLQNLPMGQGVPVIVISTEAGETKLMQTIGGGARGYIRKPFTAKALREKIVAILDGA